MHKSFQASITNTHSSDFWTTPPLFRQLWATQVHWLLWAPFLHRWLCGDSIPSGQSCFPSEQGVSEQGHCCLLAGLLSPQKELIYIKLELQNMDATLGRSGYVSHFWLRTWQSTSQGQAVANQDKPQLQITPEECDIETLPHCLVNLQLKSLSLVCLCR